MIRTQEIRERGMVLRTKTCLTCGKMMGPIAQYCPRCGSAFLRLSESLPRRAVPAIYQDKPIVQPIASTPPLPAGRPQWELAPVELVRPWPWYVGRLLRRAWGLILTFW